jgi:hypothetical protein
MIMTETASTLTAALLAEDRAEETGWLDPFDRLTCPVHRRWVHQCSHSDLHVVRVAGWRWCRPCARALQVAVDEVAGTVALRCPRCERGARTASDARLIAACEASLTASRAHRAA